MPVTWDMMTILVTVVVIVVCVLFALSALSRLVASGGRALASPDFITFGLVLTLVSRVIPVVGYAAVVVVVLGLILEFRRFAAWKAYFRKPLTALTEGVPLVPQLPERPIRVNTGGYYIEPPRKDPQNPGAIPQEVGKLDPGLREIFKERMLERLRMLELPNLVVGRSTFRERLVSSDCLCVENQAGLFWYVGLMVAFGGEGRLMIVRAMRIVSTPRAEGKPDEKPKGTFHPLAESLSSIVTGLVALVLVGIPATLTTFFLIAVALILGNSALRDRLLGWVVPPFGRVAELDTILQAELRDTWEQVRLIPVSAASAAKAAGPKPQDPTRPAPQPAVSPKATKPREW